MRFSQSQVEISQMQNKLVILLFLSFVVSQLSGCVSAVAVGAAGTAAASNSDRRHFKKINEKGKDLIP